jgi:hypothetical protein
MEYFFSISGEVTERTFSQWIDKGEINRAISLGTGAVPNLRRKRSSGESGCFYAKSNLHMDGSKM